MDEEAWRHDLFLLVGYLLTSAHGLYGEPKGYGPFRLVDAAARLLAAMRAHGMGDPYLARLEEALEAERVGHSNDEELCAVLDGLVTDHAAELKRRTPPATDEP